LMQRANRTLLISALHAWSNPKARSPARWRCVHAYTNPNSYADADPNTYRPVYADAYLHTHLNGYGHCNSYCDGNFYSNANPYCDPASTPDSSAASQSPTAPDAALDPDSYLSVQPSWVPTLPTYDGTPESFRMIDFLTFAGVGPTSRGQ
jgi:hypothetical protein